jgi:hypothetical protein
MAILDAYRRAIGNIESRGSGGYSAIGPTHPKYGRALGAYQVMESNLPQWSQEALGRQVSPDEFLANPQSKIKSSITASARISTRPATPTTPHPCGSPAGPHRKARSLPT